jgi:hypothetical protein
VGQSEPPSSSRRSSPDLFLIGRNGRGNWVVRDQTGRRGGLFVDRTSALRFALFENGRRPQAVVMVPGVLELNSDGADVPAPRPAFADVMDRKVA